MPKESYCVTFRCVVCSSIIYTQLDVRRFCSTQDGTFGVLQMLLSQEVDVIFGPLCSSGRLCKPPIQTSIAQELNVVLNSTR